MHYAEHSVQTSRVRRQPINASRRPTLVDLPADDISKIYVIQLTDVGRPPIPPQSAKRSKKTCIHFKTDSAQLVRNSSLIYVIRRLMRWDARVLGKWPDVERRERRLGSDRLANWIQLVATLTE